MKRFTKKIEIKKRKAELLERLIAYGVVTTLILYGYFVWLMFFATERQ